jgi:hypothetical protein
MSRVLALGLDPRFVDFQSMPNLTPELVRAFLDTQVQQIRALGYEVESCLVDSGETAEAALEEMVRARQFDCVMIGAGLRAAEHLLRFEKLLNLIHARLPKAKICFNTKPADSAAAVQRWVQPAAVARAKGAGAVPGTGTR